MNKINIFIALTVIVVAMTFFSAIPMAIAQEDGETEPLDITGKLTNVGTNAGFGAADETSLAETIGSIIKALLSLVGVIFMAYIVYGGYLWMTAAGNDEKLTKAKSIIRGSIIGLIIVMAAYGITAFVLSWAMQAGDYDF